MDRKEFLKACGTGLCACAAACFVPAAAAEPPAEDWRVKFVKERYGKLITALSEKMDDAVLSDVLHQVGSYCSGTMHEALAKYRGDPDGFAAYIKSFGSGDRFSYDAATKTVLATSEDRTDCICPLIGKAYTPKVACNCSLGWHQNAWQQIFQKKVEVALKDSVLRGGKRCTLEIKVLDEAI